MNGEDDDRDGVVGRWGGGNEDDAQSDVGGDDNVTLCEATIDSSPVSPCKRATLVSSSALSPTCEEALLLSTVTSGVVGGETPSCGNSERVEATTE